MDRQRWAFALVGVAAARVGDETRIALAGAAPIPWLLDSPEALEAPRRSRAPPTRSRSHARSYGERSRRSELGSRPMRTKLLALLLLALLAGGLAAAAATTRTTRLPPREAATTTPEPATTASPETDTAPAGECKTVGAPEPKPDGGSEPPEDALDPAKKYSLVVVTNCGSFTIELDQKLAPKTSASLVALAQDGFFDSTTFHRVVPAS